MSVPCFCLPKYLGDFFAGAVMGFLVCFLMWFLYETNRVIKEIEGRKK
jgi:membrane-associated phospholipid phosphatase